MSQIGDHAVTGKTGSLEYLTFALGGEEYGIEILKVREIRSRDTITSIANTPQFIKGVIDLRGTIVPIVDLRIKFQLDSAAYNEFTVVIILQLSSQMIGVVVDSVSDVMALTSDQIKPAPKFSSAIGTQYIQGIGSIDQRMVILVDIEKLLSAEELQTAQHSAVASPGH